MTVMDFILLLPPLEKVKGSTVKQFLSAHDVPTKWSSRKDNIDTKDIYKIASKQTVMVVFYRE